MASQPLPVTSLLPVSDVVTTSWPRRAVKVRLARCAVKLIVDPSGCTSPQAGQDPLRRCKVRHVRTRMVSS
ncbi:hypothetical protein ID866_3063 [Astraeus odoratus]|nr:hypothetical protein ID866_3063 [Astraeus odoratus]